MVIERKLRLNLMIGWQKANQALWYCGFITERIAKNGAKRPGCVQRHAR